MDGITDETISLHTDTVYTCPGHDPKEWCSISGGIATTESQEPLPHNSRAYTTVANAVATPRFIGGIATFLRLLHLYARHCCVALRSRCYYTGVTGTVVRGSGCLAAIANATMSCGAAYTTIAKLAIVLYCYC